MLIRLHLPPVRSCDKVGSCDSFCGKAKCKSSICVTIAPRALESSWINSGVLIERCTLHISMIYLKIHKTWEFCDMNLQMCNMYWSLRNEEMYNTLQVGPRKRYIWNHWRTCPSEWSSKILWKIFAKNVRYSWWKKSCTTWDVQNLVDSRMNYLSTGELISSLSH